LANALTFRSNNEIKKYKPHYKKKGIEKSECDVMIDPMFAVPLNNQQLANNNNGSSSSSSI
jgi:hypothetical protein